jgi:hypothetical protein
MVPLFCSSCTKLLRLLHHGRGKATLFVRKNWTDKTTRLIPLNPSVWQCLVFGMEPPTRCGGPPFASLSNWQ